MHNGTKYTKRNAFNLHSTIFQYGATPHKNPFLANEVQFHEQKVYSTPVKVSKVFPIKRTNPSFCNWIYKIIK